jgi:hypothetical protein
MNGEYAALAVRIREALADVERVAKRTEEMRAKAERTNDDGYWDAVALNLHGFYAGVERILEDVARTVDGSLPDTPGWHQELLLQMSAEMPGVRPSPIERQTRYCLDEYRRFRHIVRNVYAFNLHPARLHELVADLPACLQAFNQDLNNFSTFLERVARAGTGGADMAGIDATGTDA